MFPDDRWKDMLLILCFSWTLLNILEIRHSGLSPVVFSSLLAWTEFLVSTEIYTNTYLDISIKKITLLLGAVCNRSPLAKNFYRQGIYLSSICCGFAQKYTQVLSEGSSLFSSVETFLKTENYLPGSIKEWLWSFGEKGKREKILLGPVKWQE